MINDNRDENPCNECNRPSTECTTCINNQFYGGKHCKKCGSAKGELVLECQNPNSDNNTDRVDGELSCEYWNGK